MVFITLVAVVMAATVYLASARRLYKAILMPASRGTIHVSAARFFPIITTSTPAPHNECQEYSFKKYDQVKVVQDVIIVGKNDGKNRWNSYGLPEEVEIFKGDVGTVKTCLPRDAFFDRRKVAVIFNKHVMKEVWVAGDDLVKDEEPLKEVDEDTLTEYVLTGFPHFPQAEHMAHFKCPLSGQIFENPVVASDGRTYEKSALEEASKDSAEHPRPVTNRAINSLLEALAEQVVVPESELAKLRVADTAQRKWWELWEIKKGELENAVAEELKLKMKLKYRILESNLKYRILAEHPVALRAEMLESFKCPLSADIFTDPVVASDGFTYERSWIQRALAEKPSSPLTRESMTAELFPNRALKALLSDLILQVGPIQEAADTLMTLSVGNSSSGPSIESEATAERVPGFCEGGEGELSDYIRSLRPGDSAKAYCDRHCNSSTRVQNPGTLYCCMMGRVGGRTWCTLKYGRTGTLDVAYDGVSVWPPAPPWG